MFRTALCKQPITGFFRPKTPTCSLTRCTVKSYSTPASNRHIQPVHHRKTNAIAQAKPWNELSTGQKVAVASKTTLNLSVILAGVGLTSVIIYYISSELLGSQSSTSIFSNAVDRIREHEELKAILGTPIKGHGEPSRNSRRRNRRINSQIAEDKNGEEHLFMRFYVEGPEQSGTVKLEMIKNEKNKWEYRQFFVDVDGQGLLPPKRIYLERNM